MPENRTPRRPVPPPFPFGPAPTARAPVPAVPPPESNQGEGDRMSARRYNRNVEEFVATGEVDPAARDAAEAIDTPEGEWLRKAEAVGKSRARTTMIDRIRGAVRRLCGGSRSRRGHEVV